MLRKGMYGIREDHERKPYGDNRIEEVEKELAESEAISAEIPGLREMYVETICIFCKVTNGLYPASMSSRVNFRVQKNELQELSSFVMSGWTVFVSLQ